jgi:hypothetical protein
MLLAAGAPSAFAFSLLGPFPTGAADAFEVPAIGYHLVPPNTPYGGTDAGAPKNVGQGYRWNTPILYYSFDPSFSSFFGALGEASVDQAVAILNGLTNFSAYSSNLTEAPISSRGVNYTAGALGLFDLKSFTLTTLLEQLGLAQPERYVWCLHDRRLPTGAPNATCPIDEAYIVIQRSFDPVNFNYSSYVNGTLYSYEIIEVCGGSPATFPFPPPNAYTKVVSPDPDAETFTSVAYGAPNGFGGFYHGLTYDDIGGLRYLYATNSPSAWHVENAAPGSLLVVTNNLTPQLLFTSNLTAFADQSFTNPAATLLTLYPGLIITNETTFFTNVTITNITSYFTNNPTDPVGTPPHLVFVTNTTPGFVQRFIHGFANVVTNSIYPKSFVTVQTTFPYYPPSYPAGQFYNVTTLAPEITNIINGDIYIIPSNQCGFQFVSTILTNVVATTNVIVPTTTAAAGQTFAQAIVTYSTNHVFVVDVFQCLPNITAQFLSIDKLKLVRVDALDPLTGLFITPITNYFTLTARNPTNNTAVSDTFQRVITRPDILLAAADLTSVPSSAGYFDFPIARTFPNFNATRALAGLAGPGTIDPGAQVQITYNDVGPDFINFGFEFFIPTEQGQFTNFVWGSFDGTTNAPVVYPSTLSLIQLQNQLLMQVTTGLLTNGNVRVSYPPQQLNATGGAPPYSWSLGISSPALPPGLALSAGGVISGTPTAVGIFDIVVQATDSSSPSLTTQRNLTIEIDP